MILAELNNRYKFKYKILNKKQKKREENFLANI